MISIAIIIITAVAQPDQNGYRGQPVYSFSDWHNLNGMSPMQKWHLHEFYLILATAVHRLCNLDHYCHHINHHSHHHHDNNDIT